MNDKDRYLKESALYNLTEDLLIRMEDLGVSKSKLACLVGVDSLCIDSVFKSLKGIDIEIIIDICIALGVRLEIKVKND